MESKRQTFSPPASVWRCGRMQHSQWLGLLAVIVLLFSGSTTVKAEMSPWGEITRQPNWYEPWGEISFNFYNATKPHSFYLHDAAYGGIKGPALFIDGEYICSPDYQLAWPGGGSGNQDGIEDQRGCNGWWKDPYYNTVNGKSYEIRFWDPARSNNTYGCRIVTYIRAFELDKQHTVSILGLWKTNGQGTWWISRSFTFNPIYAPFGAPTGAKMTDYDHFSINGDLYSSYGPTWVGTTADATGKKYIAYDLLTSSKQYNQGSSSYSNLSLSITRSDFYNPVSKPVEYVVKRYISDRGEFYLYKWFTVSLPGFVRAKDLHTESDIWKKVIKVTWTPDESDDRCKEGKWRIYRKTKGDTEWTLLTISDLAYSQNPSYTDTDAELQYDTEYEYKVIFIPKNSPTGVERQELTQTVTGQLERVYNYSDFKDTRKESSVLLSWNHDTPTNNTSVTFKVWRCVDTNSFYDANGQPIKSKIIEALGNDPIATVSASSSGNTTTYEDANLGSNCTYYWYRISTDVLGSTFYSELIGPTSMSGSTAITAMSANRGTYTNVVKVQWDVTQVGTAPSRFVVARRLLGSTDDADYQQVYVTSGTESSYFFEDNTVQPGQFYQYRVVAQSNCVDNQTGTTTYVVSSTKEADGFCQSRGIISGRITFGTGTAVPDAFVLLKKNNESGDDASQFYSLRVNPQGGVLWTPKAGTGKSLFEGKAFTFQMYVRPETVVADGSTIIDGGGDFALMLKPASGNKSELYLKVGSADAKATGLKLANGAFHNVSLTCNGAKGWTVRVISGSEVKKKTITAADAVTWSGNDVAFGSDKEFTTTHAFTGYLDDIRLWSKALTDAEILDNHDRLLIGTEAGLKLYWPMDEGVISLPFTYDYSKTSGVANENHGRKQPNTAFSTIIPTENQLRLYGKTDTQGNYVIRGIPFTGEGTNYMVRPTLGIHAFSPQYQTRFVNTEALTHNGVDFEDVSSFPVSGTVYYENTDYPVEDVNLYVDGTICSKDGKAVVTDAQGKFTISVPIGDHYITVGKNGHTFVGEGRYPEDLEGIGAKVTFDSEKTGLVFYDNTLVNVAGRVVGGDTEGAKPLGMALSTNNIGQARVTLSLQEDSPYRLNVVVNKSGTTSSVDNNAETLAVASPTTDVKSTAWRTGGTQSIDVKSIVIETDPATGEFSAMVPPLLYKVKSVEMLNADAEASFAGVGFSDIDATNPLMEYTDSTDVYQGYYNKEFTYNARLSQSQSTYHCTPTFIVTQDGRDDGLFGDDTASYFNTLTGKSVDVAAINNGAYTFTYPLFEQNRSYKFKLKAYEQYTNSDDENNVVTTTVPLKNTVVTIDNQMSADRRVAAEAGTIGGVEYRPGDVIDDATLAQYVDIADNQLLLDEWGEATYTWSAGFPNIYDDLTRPLSISYEYNNQTIPWKTNPLKGIIIGALPSGSNFVTAGPDKVMMILRDPAGSGSSASWEKGSSHTSVDNDMVTTASDNTINTVTHFGVELENAAGGIAFYNIQKMEAKRDLEVGLEMSYSYEGLHGKTTTTTTTKTISTSDSPDFVGADGDVFIGTSTNMLFGNARQVLVTKATDGSYKIGSEDGLITSTEFDTEFSYTQHYIENTLIPNLEKLRNDLLVQVNASTYNSYKNTTNEVKYITKLSKDDERFGSDNDDKAIWGASAVEGTFIAGPSYRAVVPSAETDKVYQDMVHYYNESIRNWKKQLALNERQKLQVINDRQSYLISNYSFDGGNSVEYSTGTEVQRDSTYTNSWSVHLVAGGKAGLEINKTGVEVTVQTNTGSGMTHIDEEHGTTSKTFSFSLVEEGDDALSVDAFNSPDDFAPIFVTRGGQTSCPYEGETVTKYYQPGQSIGAATMKIEDPLLTVVDAKNVLSDVPRGGKAVFYLKLENLSETNSEGQFNLKLVEETNPNGALLSLSTGPLGNGHTFFVESGEALVIPLTLQQNNTDVYDYENIGLSLQSDCQSDLESVAYITAHFVPSSSDVLLAADKSVLNTSVGDVLTLSVRDYDSHYENLKAIRVQYKGERDANWSTIPGQEYVVDEKYHVGNTQMLPDGGVITVEFPMESYVDGTYLFRAQTATVYGNSEITKESDVVTVIKDMKKPQLFGLASPSDGVLNAGDEVSVTFNEDIRQSMLTETNNFRVTAALNGQQVAHSVALDGQGTECAAKTEADINLAKKDFSADLWVNYTGAGTILSHGNGTEKLEVATDAKGHLVVNIGGETYTSTKTITQKKWVFLTLNYRYTGEGGLLNAMFASDASQTMLFTDETVAAYEGIGALAVGKQMTGAVHELTLWDKARSCTDAQAEMYYTKKPSTPGLIGYWKMDEGEGLTATDYARNRHLTLAAQTWYVNNANKAVTLSGKNALKLNISECGALATEDYAVELWFKGKKSDNTKASTLFATIGKTIGMGFNASGDLTMYSNGSEISILKYQTTNLLDNAWHHLALNVLRNGNATVYVDGAQAGAVPASTVASLAGSELVLGASRTEAGSYANYFKGSVDEVRFWKATLTGDYLKRQKSTRLTGAEDGLVAYYPFEHKELNANNQVETTTSATDQAAGKFDATLSSGTMSYTDAAPKLKEAPTVTNIGFNFVANERTVVIGLTDQPDLLEGTTVDFTVKAVLDANGNESEPIHWTAFIRQNQLLWKGETEVSVEKMAGEEATFEATITNESGNSENWTLSGLPTWLTASTTSGTLKAQLSKTITFTIAESTPSGKYEQTIYLTGNNNISEPLTLNLKVKNEEPDWAVNTGDYEETMNVIGSLKVLGVQSQDEDDIVGAFIEGECRGVARPAYKDRYDGYFLMLDIYGNEGDIDKPVTFKVFDASAGIIYPVVTASQEVSYSNNAIVGRYDSPLVLDATDMIEQNIDLVQGWNWMSLSVKPDTMTVPVVFANADDKVLTVKGQTGSALYDQGSWISTITTMSNTAMYAVKTADALTLNVTGHRVKPADTPVTVANGWNWVGYCGQQVVSVADALAGMIPQNGDVIKGHRGMAYFDGYEWIGSLTTLMPGKGYKIQSAASADRTFKYPSAVAASRASRISSSSSLASSSSLFSPIAFSAYPSNMALIAQVVLDGSPVEGIDLAVFAGEECREAAVTDEHGMVFITIPGDSPCTLTFRVAYAGTVCQPSASIAYQTDALIGTPREPFVIDLGVVTGISEQRTADAQDTTYDLQGRRVERSTFNVQRPTLKKGVYIINGKKQVK